MADHSVEAGTGAGEAFRDGMEADERECKFSPTDSTCSPAVFAIGQDAGRVVKTWYDTMWGKRRQ
jgi:hypothetical protein